MRGYVQLCGDLHTIFVFCDDLPRSGDISRPAPASSLVQFYDNPRKLCLDLRQLALYNIGMKKRKRINIQEWLERDKLRHEQWLEHWKVIRVHPLTWLIIAIVVVYGFEL